MAVKSTWRFRAGDSMGGFTVGHRAKMNGNPNTAYIIGLREEAGVVKVLLDYPEPQPCDAPAGAKIARFEVLYRNISCTWCSAATVHPHRAPGLPVVHEFGSAPVVVPKGYSLVREERGTPQAVQRLYKGKYVVLVKSAEIHGRPGEFLIGVFAWVPTYEKWRHRGWYVHDITYPSGACGCISNNYEDKKWRIACDPRRLILNEPGDFTFPARDAAARAELELALQLAAPN